MNRNPFIANILLAEDNEGDIELIQDAFENIGFRNNVCVAYDGDEVLDILFKRNGNENATTPDIILLDLNLPGTDGRDVLKVIKADETLKSIPVIVLTSSQAMQDILSSYRLYANCYVIKPTTPEDFIKMVQSIKLFWLEVACLPSCHDAP